MYKGGEVRLGEGAREITAKVRVCRKYSKFLRAPNGLGKVWEAVKLRKGM